MPDDSNGVHSLPPGTIVNSGDTILPSQHNPMANDLSSGLTARFSKDGRAPATGNWNLNTFKITNLGTPVASGDAVNKQYADANSGKYQMISADYTAVSSDKNTIFRCTTAITFSMSASASLGSGWQCTVMAYGGDIVIDPNGAETINGLATLTILNGCLANIFCDGSQFFAEISPIDSTDFWWFQPLGGFVYADDGVTGFSPPPINKGYRYIELTSGLSGAGGYNENVLTGESVSGSSPLINATAVISLASSPYNGRTIRLINTERRFLRSGSAGTLQDDAIQDLYGRFVGRSNQISGVFSDAGAENTFASGTGNFSFIDFRASNVARVSNETRPRNIGVRVYRRIK